MMNNSSKTSISFRCVKLLLVGGLVGSFLSACADDSVASSDNGFAITDIASLKAFYDCYTLTQLDLPGKDFEPGDVVQFIDTGVSHNTYTLSTGQTDDSLTVALPDNLVDREYGIYIVRRNAKFLYGKSYFGRQDCRNLTAQNHPRLLMDAGDFETLKAQLATADPESLLAQMHTECTVVADAWGMAPANLVFQLDASGKRILTVAREALLRIFSCAYACRITRENSWPVVHNGTPSRGRCSPSVLNT